MKRGSEFHKTISAAARGGGMEAYMKINTKVGKLETKADFVRLMYEILNPLKAFYGKNPGRLKLGDTGAYYDNEAVEMEAFSRPLWALVPFFAGGGRDNEFSDIYKRGIISGTDARSDGYWGKCGNFDQRFVEMASIAFGIVKAPGLFYDRLNDDEKNKLCDYLLQINENPLPSCNWLMFAVLVNVAMKKTGREYSQEKLEWYLNEIDTYYIGNGWYQDGNPGNRDYYISFGIHYYCLLYVVLMGDEDKERCEKYKKRAELFGRDFIYWFDENGAAIPYGRSMTYRFAQVSFYSACIMADVYPLSIEIMKGLIVRHLKDWLSKPIFDNGKILTIGYGYSNLFMSEKYNAPGSPYWAMKTFGILMLDDNHRFWSVKSADYPVGKGVYYVKEAEMIYAHAGSHVAAYVPGTIKGVWHGQMPAKYSKFAYDSRFAISVPRSDSELSEMAPDNMLVFETGGRYYERRGVDSYEVTEKKAVSVWTPVSGIKVKTIIIPDIDGHKRIHHIESEIECEAYECGFAINSSAASEYEGSTDKITATAKNKYTYSTITIENNESANPLLIYTAPNTHYLYPKTVIPAVKIHIHRGINEIVSEIRCEIY